MADNELMRICVVGGNPVSAFLSWRLQATNACDVTLVWKSGYEHVAQYGISFKSPTFGNERFKPRHVVRNPEDAASAREGPFDYVVLCVKALPDVYDLASVIDSVVTPQHTCILVNTTHTLGVEAALEERFPTNVVLSLVSGAELTQLGQSEFEHKGPTDIWIGPASQNKNIPQSIQEDMAQALAVTLSSGQVECKVSPNIRQQQYERVMGPIAFHPISVIFETPNHAALLEKVGVRDMVSEVLDELLRLAAANGCKFDADFKQKTIDEMTKASGESIMWQDYVARRPMEIETYLGSPVKLARDNKVSVPRIETLYAILHNLNAVNRNRPKPGDPNANIMPPSSPTAPQLPRMPSQNSHRPMMNGMPNGNGMPPRQPRPRNSSNLSQAGMRRGPPPMNGGPPNGYPRPPPSMNGGGSRQPSRRGSLEENSLEEFSHLVLYDDIPEGSEPSVAGDNSDITLRERELALRQRELAIREQEMRMRRGPPGPPGPPGGPGGPGPRRGPHPMRNSKQVFDDDDDDDDDYFDPTANPAPPLIDPDNFDMMSVTSRKNRKAPEQNPAQFRRNPDNLPPPTRGGRFRPSFGRNRTSQVGHTHAPMTTENILEDPLLSCSSNRYGAVDRGAMSAGSRANSLTAARLDDLQYGPGPGGPPGMNGAYPRRASQSPGNPYSPSMRGGSRRGSPPNGYGPGMNGRPSPPDGVRQPVPRHPPGQGNAVAPQQVEQHIGVSALPQTKPRNVRSLTGSASASAGSGESESANSSQGSLPPRPPIGVR
ncbi:ketopantoate reductase PanE/ApbA-domain-containing protein [Fusarium solani]|uniref:Ketopantoate reductase PanE/ApbA-domain-containing protein n=1 Tax=Fusarium solani TaxID=169388 RepID=A0A9P9RB40_FUSSL|nr:ketopantoate reductase PanE/ApbA-domain-containing protein [Fusarium solani]KAH7271615.1 ketopantoate reductase PanE/ApbA-domain-containing protein [Fusarium solani]